MRRHVRGLGGVGNAARRDRRKRATQILRCDVPGSGLLGGVDDGAGHVALVRRSSRARHRTDEVAGLTASGGELGTQTPGQLRLERGEDRRRVRLTSRLAGRDPRGRPVTLRSRPLSGDTKVELDEVDVLPAEREHLGESRAGEREQRDPDPVRLLGVLSTIVASWRSSSRGRSVEVLRFGSSDGSSSSIGLRVTSLRERASRKTARSTVSAWCSRDSESFLRRIERRSSATWAGSIAPSRVSPRAGRT